MNRVEFESLRLQLMTENFDLLLLIESVASKFAEYARAHKVHIGSFMTPELKRSLHGDKEAISSLLEFLVEKAINVSANSNFEPGQFAVLVEALERADLSKNSFRIAVSDTRSELDR